MTNRVSSLIVLSALTVAVLSGCAGVSFYTDPTLKTRTGIPVYGSKPYLLVSRTGAKDKPVETSIIYLPNTEKVIYAYPRSGFGSANLTMSLAGGQMTSFGQQTDTKVPELITSLSGLVTARADAEKAEAEAKSIRAAIGTQQSAIPASVAGQKVLDIADEILRKATNGSLPELTDQELRTLKTVAQALKAAGNSLLAPANAPFAQQQFDVINAQSEILKKYPSPTGSTTRDNSLQIVQAWAEELRKLFSTTQPEKEDLPTFELYEILQQPGAAPVLRKVSLS